MAFNSGVSAEAWPFVITVWSYPSWPVAFAIAAWLAYARKTDRLAGVLTAFTFMPVLGLDYRSCIFVFFVFGWDLEQLSNYVIPHLMKFL